MNIKEFRAKFPDYDDMTDTDLAAALHSKHYSDMPKHEFDKMFIGAPIHDDLENAAVRAEDSAQLQKIDPSIKPVIVGTPQEILSLKRGGQISRKSVLFLAVPGKAYVIDPKGVQGIYGGSEVGAVKRAKWDLLKGNDSHLLGYPQRGPETVAVTKQGEVLTELPRISDEAKAGNLAYGASGQAADALGKSVEVASAIRGNTPRKWKTIGKEIDDERDHESRQGYALGQNAGQETGAEGERGQEGQVTGLRPSVLYRGAQLTDGEKHDEILENNGLDTDQGQRGFQTPDGNFLSRFGAMQWIEANQPAVRERLKELGVSELHSQDLKRAYESV